jgi:CBS domain-containing protein
MKVQDFMTHGVRTVRPQDSLAAAAKAMWDGDCGALPVVDGERVAAMLTDRDICMAAYTQGRQLAEIPVATAMSKRLVTCRANDAVGVAEARMREHQVRRLPVIDARQRLVGILSLNDIALLAAEESARGQREVTAEEVGATLAAICRHRSTALPAQVMSPLTSTK